uniref:Uncharacterized protein n=1 Tax=Setaria italica TaxID=4555 RepID=K3ZPA9_SETIT
MLLHFKKMRAQRKSVHLLSTKGSIGMEWNGGELRITRSFILWGSFGS